MEDQITEEINSGVNVFTCRIGYSDSARMELEDAVTVGRFILKSSGTVFDDKENTYDSLYQIIETEFNTNSQELYVYAEDAGLELINNVVPESTQKNKTLKQMLWAIIPSGWTINLIGTRQGQRHVPGMVRTQQRKESILFQRFSGVRCITYSSLNGLLSVQKY